MRSIVFPAVMLAMSFCAAQPITKAKVAQAGKEPGIAWEVRGVWRTAPKGEPVRTAQHIEPGTLLLPDSGSANSITILLPDGQRVRYECFTTGDCERGFRVPSLYRNPDPSATAMLGRIQAVLVQRPQPDDPTPPRVGRDESVAIIGPDHHIRIAGLASALENGSYSYDIRSLDSSHLEQKGIQLEKSSQTLSLLVPAAGLYDVLVYDAGGKPRVDLLVAALGRAQGATIVKSFAQAHALLADWNQDYQGWPVHDFQRAYLESLVLGIHAVPSVFAHVNGVSRADASVEPAFSPRPGVFKRDIEVSLHCDTPGALIHYTVDGSQPLSNSPVYRAPIVVKSTELTIKAFASAPDHKDSAVVTGIFRIEESTVPDLSH